MQRPIFHALSILAVLALGGLLQYGLHKPWGGHHDLGWWLWVPAAVAVALGIGCAVGGFFTARGGVGISPLVLLVPAGLASLAGVAWVVEMGWLAGQLETPAVARAEELEGNRRIFVATIRGHQRAYLALIWGGVGFATVAALAGCRPGARVPELGERNPWILRSVTAGSLLGLAVVVTYLVRYVTLVKRLQAQSLSTTWADLQTHASGLMTIEGGWVLAPMLVALVVLLSAPLLILALYPHTNPLDETSSRAQASARALGAASILGAALALGAAVRVKTAPALTSFMLTMDTRNERRQFLDKLVAGNCPDPWDQYLASGGGTIALLVVGVLVALPLFATAGQRTRCWIAPMTLVLACLICLGLSRGWSVNRAHQMLGPNCTVECVERDKFNAVLCLERHPRSNEMLRDKCYGGFSGGEDAEFRLPRVESHDCPRVAVHVRTKQSELSVDGVRIMDLVDWSAGGDSNPYRGQQRLTEVFTEKAEDSRAIAARIANQPFTGEILLSLDHRTPMELVDSIRWSASEAGFHDQSIVVQLPGNSRIERYRTVRLDPHPDDSQPSPWEPMPPGKYWILNIRADALTVASPDGTAQTAPDATSLATQLRGSLIVPGAAPLWVTHDPDVTLGKELEARATLTGKGLFSEAYSLPFGTGDQPVPELL